MTFLTSVLSFIFAPFIAVGLMLGTALAPEPEPTLGATESIPTTIAFFETTLASAITSDATTFTLTSATDADGTTLASSTYAFVIDEGSSNEEIVIADCTGTVCTNVERGISVRTGNTSVAALKKAHRRGASVKITDAPILMLVARALRGESVTDFTPAGNGSLVDKEYVDNLALGTTTVAATTLDDGIGELATGLEAASSTATGDSGSPLFLHTGISTSTAGVANTIPVTGSDGTLDTDYFASSTWSTQTLTYAVSYASTTIFSNGTSTYTLGTGVKFIVVEAVGGGGGGGNPGGTDEGAGGGAGAYARETFLASELSATTSVTAGTGGASEAGGNPSVFGSYLTAGGGGGCNNQTIGSGGTATGGDLNISGQNGFTHGTPNGGSGGMSHYGVTYGSGGIGATNGSGEGTGTTGVVIITEYF